MTMPDFKIEQTEDNLYDALGSAASSPFAGPLITSAKNGRAQKVTVPEAEVDKVRQHIRQVGSKNGLSVKTKDHPAGNGQVTIVFQARAKDAAKNGGNAPATKK